jgi:hypothetical protein
MIPLKRILKIRVLFLSLVIVILMLGLTACKTGKPSTDLPAPDPAYSDPLEDQTYEKAVMESEPEFTEKELLQIMLDIQPVTKGSMDEVLDYLTGAPGWDRNRAYYILNKIAVAEYILSEPDVRQVLMAEYPQGLPTDKEFELVRKNRAAVHKGMGIEE